MLRQPIENAGMNEALVRITYHLVVLDFRRRPGAYRQNLGMSIIELAEQMRAQGYHNLYWTLNGCARWLMQGYTLAAWRHEASTASGVRAFHKRSGRGRGRGRPPC